MAFLDTSGYVFGSGDPMSGSLGGFEHAKAYTETSTTPVSPLSSFVNLWLLINRDEQTVACVHDSGKAFLVGEREVNLADAYQSYGHNLNAMLIGEFGALITGKS